MTTKSTTTMTKEEAYRQVLENVSGQLNTLAQIDPRTNPDELKSILGSLAKLSAEILEKVGSASSNEEIAEIVDEYI